MIKGTGGFLNPELILQQLDLKPNMQVADFGCGHGYFAIPLAKIVTQGRVYAVDVLKEALEAVRSKAELEHINNIQTIRANLEILGSSKLPDKSIDLVLLANILFQSQKKEEIIKEAYRVLKDEGRLVIIDWYAEAALAPKEGWLVAPSEIKTLTKKLGFELIREFDVDNQHYGLIFKKSYSE